MGNIIQIERLCYAKICWEKALLYGLINNCLGKSKNLKPQGSLCVLPLVSFLLRNSPQKLFSRLSVLKFCKIPLETLAVDFCFSCRAETFISTEIELCRMLSSECWSSYFSRYIRLIPVTKSNYLGSFMKKLFLKLLQYSQENNCVGVCF